MANYNVDIGVKVRGEELKKFGEQLKQTKKQVNGVNRFLDTFRKQNIRVNESITNLNAQLSTARTTFQNATIGTKQQVQAAKDLILANENSIFVNVHKNPSNTKDIDKLEKEIVALNYEEYEQYINKNK